MQPDRLDVEPHDSEQLEEIHMLADLILACSTRLTRLSDVVIDTALGLSHANHENVA